MDIPVEIKGCIADICSEVFSWEKLETFGNRLGLLPEEIEERRGMEHGKKKISLYIMNQSETELEIAIKTLMDMAKRGTFNDDQRELVMDKLNPIMEQKLEATVNKRGEIISKDIFLDQKGELINKKLINNSFNNTKIIFEEAYKTYLKSEKGSLSLLRSAYESLIREIIRDKGLTHTNMKDDLDQLKSLGIIEDLEVQNYTCPKCQHNKRDHEFNYSYNIFGLLSNFGSHDGITDKKKSDMIFTATISFIYYLLKSYEDNS